MFLNIVKYTCRIRKSPNLGRVNKRAKLFDRKGKNEQERSLRVAAKNHDN